MKKILSIGALACIFALLCSCSDDSDTATQIPIARSPQTITYQAGTKLYELNNNVGTLTLKGFPRSKIFYLLKTNPTETVVDKANTHYIADGTNIFLKKSYHATRNAGAVDEALESAPTDITGTSHRECLSVKLNEQFDRELAKKHSERAAFALTAPTAFPVDYRNKQINPVVGTTQKEFYLDVETEDAKLQWYSKGTATLQAIGRNAQGKAICYAWVLGEVKGYDAAGNELYTEETSFTEEETAPIGKVNRKLAQAYADAFVKIYDLDTTLMGNPPNKVFYDTEGNPNSLVDIDYLSDTSSIINLLFWDVRHQKEYATIAGYYWIKDLFPKKEDAKTITGTAPSPDSYTTYSNAGNYLYINAYLSNDTGNILTTIAHEFQHMISRNMKGIENRTDTELGEANSTIFEEMMSVGTEDFVFMFFPEIHFNSDTGIMYLPDYESLYHINGFEVSGDLVNQLYNLHYGAGFTFAAWFMRKFGVGTMYEITHNQKVDLDGILTGINKCTTTTETIESLLKQYAYDLLPLKSETVFSKPSPSLAPDNPHYCTAQSYGYPLIALNLKGTNNKDTTGFDETSEEWKRKFNPPDAEYGECSTPGITCFDSNTIANLRPYGLMIHSVGQILDGSTPATLEFSSDSIPSPSEKMYLVLKE